MKKVKYIGMIFFLCFALISSFVCIPYVNIMADEDQDLGGEEFWCPVNGKDYEFTVNNTWNEEGYIDYIEFDDSYIKNTSLGENYTLEELDGNFSLRYIPLEIVNDVLKENMEMSGDTCGISREMLEVLDCFNKINV